MRSWQTGLAAAVVLVSAASTGSAQTVLSEAELDRVTAGVELPAGLIPTGVPSINSNLSTALLGAGSQRRTVGFEQRSQGNTSTGNTLLLVGTSLRLLGFSFR